MPYDVPEQLESPRLVLRMLQGFSGGVLLVAGQAIIFLAWPRSDQPVLQALFAIGSVVAPATMAPALQGWLLDGLDSLQICVGYKSNGKVSGQPPLFAEAFAEVEPVYEEMPGWKESTIVIRFWIIASPISPTIMKPRSSAAPRGS